MERQNEIQKNLKSSTENTKITLSTKTYSLAERAKYGEIAAANSTQELVHSPAMVSIIKSRVNGLEVCKKSIEMGLRKAALSLNISMSDDRAALLAEDMLEDFMYDPIDMILMVLKKGRKGHYNDVAKTYRELNMEVISTWMTIEREKMMEEKAANQRELTERGVNEVVRQIPGEHTEKLLKSLDDKKVKEERKRPLVSEDKYYEFLQENIGDLSKSELTKIKKQAEEKDSFGDVRFPKVVELVNEQLNKSK